MNISQKNVADGILAFNKSSRETLSSMRQFEINRVFNMKELSFFAQVRNFAFNVENALNNNVEHVCVYSQTINRVKSNNKGKSVADLGAMALVISQAQKIESELQDAGYTAYTKLTDGGQILKVYKKEKEEETLAKLHVEFDAIRKQVESVSNDIFFKMKELEDTQKSKALIKAQAEALGLKISFD